MKDSMAWKVALVAIVVGLIILAAEAKKANKDSKPEPAPSVSVSASHARK